MHVTFMETLPYLLGGVGVLASFIAGCLVLRQGSKYRRERLQTYVTGNRTSIETHRGPPEDAKDGDTWIGSDKRLLTRVNGSWVEPNDVVMDTVQHRRVLRGDGAWVDPNRLDAELFKDEADRKRAIRELAHMLRHRFHGETLLFIRTNPLTQMLAITLILSGLGGYGFSPAYAKQEVDRVLALGHNGLAEAWAMAVEMVREEGREVRRREARAECAQLRQRNMVKSRPWLRQLHRLQADSHNQIVHCIRDQERERSISNYIQGPVSRSSPLGRI